MEDGTFVHGGAVHAAARTLGCGVSEILDFSASINPLGPPSWLRAVVARSLDIVQHYPWPRAEPVREAASRRYGVAEARLVVGAGSSELVFALPRVAGLGRAVIPVPCYSDYPRAAAAAGLRVELVPPGPGLAVDLAAVEQALAAGPALVMLGHPGNPVGLPLPTSAVTALAARHPASLFVVDEAFADFLPPGTPRLVAGDSPNVVVLVSLTKMYAIPALRVGLAAADPEIVRRFEAVLPPWNVCGPAQAVAQAALDDVAFAEESARTLALWRRDLVEQLRRRLHWRVYAGQANYVLCELATDARPVVQRLAAQGILIRGCGTIPGLDHRFVRLAVRRPEDHARLVAALDACAGVSRKRRSRRTPALMVAGCSSDAGKSLLVAGLCRVLWQDGVRVAPFKAQNMSLNSAVTPEGGEMGRAQALQAAACGRTPDVRMNPVLLKPRTDTGSQVMVLGKPWADLDVAGYHRAKEQLWPVITDAYARLAAEAEAVLLEGAGSIAEVNLKAHDVVNLRMARHAGASVLVVGDIDRGGVFASFVGTMEVLEPWERALVAGFVVNKFRGRQDLLLPAMDYVERFTGRPVWGVVPYLDRVGLPDEDSVAFKAAAAVHGAGPVTVAVVDLPRIANGTDVDPLRLEPDVRVVRARTPEDLEGACVIILPGSRSVAQDLEFLHASGLAAALRRAVSCGVEVIGICGGLQMLGTAIADPEGVESRLPARPLGLLAVETVFAPAKELVATAARHLPSGLELSGYEIHHGRTRPLGEVAPVVVRPDGTVIGWGHGRVWGTYLHGLFDADPFRWHLVDGWRARLGLAPRGPGAVYDVNAALDRLAQVLRQSLPMERVYAALERSATTRCVP
jgi:cobyric acid synthase CobQ/L-threonine-O-3-phosphate decarboxylase